MVDTYGLLETIQTLKLLANFNLTFGWCLNLKKKKEH